MHASRSPCQACPSLLALSETVSVAIQPCPPFNPNSTLSVGCRTKSLLGTHARTSVSQLNVGMKYLCSPHSPHTTLAISRWCWHLLVCPNKHIKPLPSRVNPATKPSSSSTMCQSQPPLNQLHLLSVMSMRIIVMPSLMPMPAPCCLSGQFSLGSWHPSGHPHTRTAHTHARFSNWHTHTHTHTLCICWPVV